MPLLPVNLVVELSESPLVEDVFDTVFNSKCGKPLALGHFSPPFACACNSIVLPPNPALQVGRHHPSHPSFPSDIKSSIGDPYAYNSISDGMDQLKQEVEYAKSAAEEAKDAAESARYAIESHF